MKPTLIEPREAWLQYQEQAEILMMLCDNVELVFPENQHALENTVSLLQETQAHVNPQTFAALWQTVAIVLNLEGWTLDKRNFEVRNTLTNEYYRFNRPSEVKIRGFTSEAGYNNWWREFKNRNGDMIS